MVGFEYEYYKLEYEYRVHFDFSQLNIHFKINNKTRRCVFPFHFANISKTTCDKNLIFTFNEE